MKNIPLTQGKVAIVDDEDFETLRHFTWHAYKARNTYYAARNITTDKGSRKIRMHRQILNMCDNEIVCDHRDGNGLNNQRGNIRIATKSQNATNKANRRNNFKSKYFGVQACAHGGWQAKIRKDYKDIYLGFYKVQEEAALAYNKKAKEIHGEFAILNVVPLK